MSSADPLGRPVPVHVHMPEFESNLNFESQNLQWMLLRRILIFGDLRRRRSKKNHDKTTLFLIPVERGGSIAAVRPGRKGTVVPSKPGRKKCRKLEGTMVPSKPGRKGPRCPPSSAREDCDRDTLLAMLGGEDPT